MQGNQLKFDKKFNSIVNKIKKYQKTKEKK